MSAARSPRKKSAKAAKVAASLLPVARVAVDVSLPHLDRAFDYLVDESQSEAAQVGCRVRVRFAGQLVDGFVLERVEATEHGGRLSFLDRVVSAEPVLSSEIAGLARAVADRWAGTFSDVVRLAVPPRHARAESAPAEPAAGAPEVPGGGLDRYVDGPALIGALGRGESPHVVAAVPPGDWPAELAQLATATLASGRGAVIVVPDHRDLDRLDAALSSALGPGRHIVLAAGLGPEERYRRFLGVRRGQVRCVVGTRSAVWSPVADIGLVAVWDDGDDVLAEPRAPYAHARDVAVLRAHLAGAGLVLAGHAVTAEGATLTASGWAVSLDPTPDARRRALPAVRTPEADERDDPLARAARLPTSAWKAAHDALAAGAPVLVQVPRRGYQPTLSCDRCRTPARCPVCAGPLARAAEDAPAQCRWCGAVATGWSCAACGGKTLRAVVIGARRTAEELGRAFPGVPVRTSGGDAVLARVPQRQAVVVATPGAEPVAEGGYGAALLLDGWAMLSRPDLRAGEEALRRWLNASALVRPETAGGRVVVVAPSELRPVQALLRWQPRWHAEREIQERAALHLPPAARLATVTGVPAAVHELLELAELPAGSEVLGPVPTHESRDGGPAERMVVRTPRRSGAELATALKHAAAQRSARKAPETPRIELDPQTLG